MKDIILDELNEVAADYINKIKSLPDGSAEKTAAIDELTAIHKLKMEETKAKQARWTQYLATGAQVGVAIGGWVFYNVVLNKEHYFEINNTPRTSTFRNLLSRMFPKF